MLLFLQSKLMLLAVSLVLIPRLSFALKLNETSTGLKQQLPAFTAPSLATIASSSSAAKSSKAGRDSQSSSNKNNTSIAQTESQWLGTTTSWAPLPRDHITVRANVSDRPPGIEQATQCWQSLLTWRRESVSFVNENIAGHSWPLSTFWSHTEATWNVSTTGYPGHVSTYKLCDGTPRANVRPFTTTETLSTTYWASFTNTVTPSPPSAPCSLSPRDCRLLYVDTNASLQDEDELLEQCGNPAHGADGGCLLGGGPVELLYFPVQVNNHTLCKNTSISAVPETGFSEVTTWGSTFTSGSVYLSFKTLYATYDGFWDNVGPTFSDLIVTLHSSDISSHCGGWHGAYGTGTPLNYADLNWPVPASAYSCQHRCTRNVHRSPTLFPDNEIFYNFAPSSYTPQCNTIWSDVNPVLAIPTKIKSMVPQWSHCSYWNANLANFWFDPPIALQPRDVAAEPTAPSILESTAAAPCSTPLSPAAPSTRAPSSRTEIRDPPAATRTSSMGSGHSLQEDSSHDLATTSHHVVNGPMTSVSDPVVLSSTAAVATATENSSNTDGSGLSSQALSDPAMALAPALSVLTEALSHSASDPVQPSSTTEISSAPADVVFTYDPQPDPSSPSSGDADSIGTHGAPDQHTDDAFGTFGSDLTTTIIQTDNDGAPTASPNPTMTIPNIVITASPSGLTADESPIAAGSFTLHTVPDFQHSGILILGGQTLSNGGSPATVSGHTITHDQSGLVLLSGSSTVAFTSVEAIAAAPSSLTISVFPVTGWPSALVIGKTTLSVGGPPMMTEGQVVTYASDGLVVQGAKTTRIFKPVFASAQSSPNDRDGVYALGSLTLTASSILGASGALLVNGETISQGGDALTMHDATITAGPSGLAVFKPSTTLPMSTLAETEELPAVVSKSTRTTTAETTSAPWSTLLAPSFKPEGAVTTTSDAAGRTFGQCWSAWPTYILLMFVLIGNM